MFAYKIQNTRAHSNCILKAIVLSPRCCAVVAVAVCCAVTAVLSFTALWHFFQYLNLSNTQIKITFSCIGNVNAQENFNARCSICNERSVVVSVLVVVREVLLHKCEKKYRKRRNRAVATSNSTASTLRLHSI